MRDIHDRSFAEEYLTDNLHKIDLALDRLDRHPDLAIDCEARRRLTQLKAQLTAAIEEFPSRETRRRAPA